MAQSREVLERHLQRAKQALQSHVERLNSQKIDPKQHRRDATWRKLNAKLRQINSRLQSVAVAESLLKTPIDNSRSEAAPAKAKSAAKETKKVDRKAAEKAAAAEA